MAQTSPSDLGFRSVTFELLIFFAEEGRFVNKSVSKSKEKKEK